MTSGGAGPDDPFVFDEAWARAGIPETSQRRRTPLPAASRTTPPGPRDWAPPARSSMRHRSTRWILLVTVLAAGALVAALVAGRGPRPAHAPIAGGTAVASPSPSGTDTEGRVDGLTPSTAVGSCFDLHGSVDETATFVPCTLAHRLQLVGLERATGDDRHYPADSYWNGPVRQRCVADLVAFSHQPQRRWPPQLSETQFVPRHDGWATGDRTIYCAGVVAPSTSHSLVHLKPYRGTHAPIPDAPGSSALDPDAPVTITGRLGLVQDGPDVCITVTPKGAGPVALQPQGRYSLTWRIIDGTAQRAESGIALAPRPGPGDVVAHLGQHVRLDGAYTAAAGATCGTPRQFVFTDVHRG